MAFRANEVIEQMEIEQMSKRSKGHKNLKKIRVKLILQYIQCYLQSMSLLRRPKKILKYVNAILS